MKTLFHSHAVNAFFDQHFSRSTCVCETTKSDNDDNNNSNSNRHTEPIPCAVLYHIYSPASCIFLVCYVCYCCCFKQDESSVSVFAFYIGCVLLLLIFFIHHALLYSFNLTRTVFLHVCSVYWHAFVSNVHVSSFTIHAAYTQHSTE